MNILFLEIHPLKGLHLKINTPGQSSRKYLEKARGTIQAQQSNGQMVALCTVSVQVAGTQQHGGELRLAHGGAPGPGAALPGRRPAGPGLQPRGHSRAHHGVLPKVPHSQLRQQISPAGRRTVSTFKGSPN